jgi:hypothetical protein
MLKSIKKTILKANSVTQSRQEGKEKLLKTLRFSFAIFASWRENPHFDESLAYCKITQSKYTIAKPDCLLTTVPTSLQLQWYFGT